MSCRKAATPTRSRPRHDPELVRIAAGMAGVMLVSLILLFVQLHADSAGLAILAA